ncbi:MAG: helicase [Pseudomonadales bacterium]|nr:helicase [Pseudomonadales bacterium]MBO7005041.1 helicase [Pseudomonadales bacterium]
MTTKKTKNLSLDFYSEPSRGLLSADDSIWPDSERFPLNLDKRKAESIILEDLRESEHPLIVCGYASLDRCIDFASSSSSDDIRILFGNEPFTSERQSYSTRKSSAIAAETYWLERGISVLMSQKILQMIEKVESGVVKVRYLDRNPGLHAKIYCGDEAVTLGSSNFTNFGMRQQHEANSRFTAKREKKRFAELSQIAENYWTESVDYSTNIIKLLEGLLKVVSWEEALARASGELLDGEWANKYLDHEYLATDNLWPSQKQGIAQALYVLSNQGSVLVADATGSGKTKMGVHLIGSIQDQLLRSNRLGRGKPILICPPLVEHSWQNEVAMSNLTLTVHSHGKLSRANSSDNNALLSALQRAQILCIDEGHNFLNNQSMRSQQLLRNIADHVVLFTATPINKSVTDLLHIADLLGADNLQPRTVEAFSKILGYRAVTPDLSSEELSTLRNEIQRFTVRRTKSTLNKLIDESPASYTSKDGRQCRFPKHKAKFYDLAESSDDRALAAEIRAAAGELYGVTHFQKPIVMPEKLKKTGMSETQYLTRRLNGARTLAAYSIMSSLRSSRAALIEHINGTADAIERYEIRNFKKASSGNIKRTILRLELPQHDIDAELPDWLKDSEAHRSACQHDLKIYQRITNLVSKLSDGRETEKANLLLQLTNDHGLVLAFDSRPITLALLRDMLKHQSADTAVLIATGDSASNRKEFINSFELGSTKSRTIGLCSDSLSEGVNLQQAGVLAHLDIPSVVRIAEQRVGRIDRMDSPHEEVEAWWPNDSEEFALSSDHRFLERYEMVDSLLGSNMPLPEDRTSRSTSVSAKELAEEYEEMSNLGSWDGLQDAFQPVRNLIDGDSALVSPKVYRHYRNIKQSVLARVSLVESKSPWAFFCLSAGPFGAPKWLFFRNLEGQVDSELSEVVEQLRIQLAGDIESAPVDARAIKQLSRFIGLLNRIERSFLSMKKQRALVEMETVLEKYVALANQTQSTEDFEQLSSILLLLNSNNDELNPDWDEIASRWLEVIRPVWFEKLQSPRTRPLLLRDIREDLSQRASDLIPVVLSKFQEIPTIDRPEDRIKACIVGVS